MQPQQSALRSSCSLLHQLSQDLLTATAPGELNYGCDSSDCLLCQGQRQFCNQSIVDSACTWLGQRRLSGTAVQAPQADTQLGPAQPPSSAVSTSTTASAATAQAAQEQAVQLQRQPQPQRPRPLDEHVLQQPQHKRLKPCPAGASAASAGSTATAVLLLQQQPQGACGSLGGEAPTAPPPQPPPPQQQQQAQAGPLCTSPLLPAGSRCWQWQPEFGAREDPAPARFAELARLQPAADATAGHQSVARHDRISGLEFSTDGQLLATAGVSKEVALYSLAALQDAEWLAAEAAAAGIAANSNSAAGQRAQQNLQQRLQLGRPLQAPGAPLLPPMATVRLPGKVSSIAFSPDMQGVISIGDYDGTLMQVHLASGHHLSEVDAHAGRRIWSICHSRLRRHVAVTASDDCSAKLWAGCGLGSLVASVRAPGRPALCGADFSSSCEHLLALAAADARVYLYDLRRLAQPLAALHGHSRQVAYAKFFGPQQLVSASVDGTLAVWDLAPILGLAAGPAAAGSEPAGPVPGVDGAVPQQHGSAREGSCSTAAASCCSAAAPAHGAAAAAAARPAAAAWRQQPWKVFQGHTNEKNFVGLAVDPAAGLMAVGSETPEVFTYHTSWSSPLARFSMEEEEEEEEAAAPPQQQQQQPAGSLLQQMQQSVAVGWTQGAQPHQPPKLQQLQQRQSVSAVAWQPSQGGAASQGGRGCAAGLLAAATSGGECRLLGLLQP